MIKTLKRARTYQLMLTSLMLWLLGAGSALALVHPDVVLRGPGGEYIDLDAAGPQPAYSAKNTCGGCHTYANIEQHSYHVQIGANQQMGWDMWNPDSANTYKSGVAPKGKNWVQSPGHVGKW